VRVMVLAPHRSGSQSGPRGPCRCRRRACWPFRIWRESPWSEEPGPGSIAGSPQRDRRDS
jgi:hypothetical protein